MTLSLGGDGSTFILRPESQEVQTLAVETGLDRSMPATRRAGSDVFHVYNEYQAIPFMEWASVEAMAALAEPYGQYAASLAREDDLQIPCPDGLEPYPFQRAGVRYASERKNSVIGDQMGLGKTITAILLDNYTGADRVLIVCPASVRLHWHKKIREWSTIRRVLAYPIQKSSDGVHPTANYTIISYDLLRNPALLEALMAHNYDRIYLDEIHYLKNISTGRSKAVFGGLRPEDAEILYDRAASVVGLTGTFLPNRPRECYNVTRHLAWDAIDWMAEEPFYRRYNPSMTMETGFVREEKGRLHELRARMRVNFLVRRLKRDVMKQLPPVSYELAYVEPNGEIKKALQAEKLLNIDVDKMDNMNPDILGNLATVRRQMGIAKVPRVVEFVATMLEGEARKIVIFAHHRDVIHGLAAKLEKFGVVIIMGATSMIGRELAKEKFIEDPDTHILLGNIQSAGTGIDGLQLVCSNAVFAEASWVPGENDQCVERLDRIGQTEPIEAQFLVAPGSLDEKIIGRAIKKAQAIHVALDGG